MAFNANEHMMKLKGKDYLQVAWRLVWFREDHPDFGLNAEALEITEDHAIFKATITDANGVQVSSGHGSESKRDFGDFIERAETKAVGRALAMLGYGTQFAADELDEGERIVDSPIDRAPRGSADAAQKVGEEKLAKMGGAKEVKPAPNEQMAAAGQVQFIMDNLDVFSTDEINRMADKFGPELERMPLAIASKTVAKIQQRLTQTA